MQKCGICCVVFKGELKLFHFIGKNNYAKSDKYWSSKLQFLLQIIKNMYLRTDGAVTYLQLTTLHNFSKRKNTLRFSYMSS